MKGYKIFRPDMTCNGMQYAPGQEYRMDEKPVLCRRGYHFCVNPVDLFNYYEFTPENIVCHVEALGKVIGGDDDSKHVTDYIKIGDRIPWGDVLALVNTGEGNSGLANSGDYNSGDYNSGYRNSGDYNSGDYNSGDYNSGYRHSGFFCTGEAHMTLFNQPTDLTYREVVNMLPCVVLTPCAWVDSDDMSDYEKATHPEHETIGGYLKKRTLTEAWQEWWGNADDDDRQKILSLPNFDAEIFREITGITVEVPDA